MATDSPGLCQVAEEDVCQRIFKSLEDTGVSRVVLAGKAGIGKTWVASEACKRATKDGSCYLALWLHLNRKFDEGSLYEDIAAQLSLFHEFEETEEDDGKEKEEEEKSGTLKDKIKEELSKKKRYKKSASSSGAKQPAAGENAKGGKKLAKGEKNLAEGKKSTASEGEKKPAKGEKNLAEGDKKSAPSAQEKYLLLILNDEGSLTKEDEVMTDLKLSEFLQGYGPIKTLITRRKGDESSANHPGEIEPVTENNSTEVESPTKNDSGEIQSAADGNAGKTESLAENSSQASPEPGTKDETEALLDSLTESKMQALLESLTKDESRDLLEKTWGTDNFTLKNTIVSKSFCLPAAVVVLARSLNCIALNHPDSSRDEYVKKVFKEVVPSDSHDAAAGSESDISLLNHVLHLGYELLKSDDKLNSATVDCFWHSLDFFTHCGCVYYRDLITHWILEGYFDPVRSVEKAYQAGHSVLLELINRGILKIQENNVVVPEVAMSNLIDLRVHGFLSASRLGFSRVYGGEKARGLGRNTVIDDMIKTVRTNKKGEKLSTILVSGNRLRQEAPKKFFKNEEMKDLEVLGLFSPTLDSLVPSLSELKKLRFLVIRDYDLLETIDELADLKRLQVLEVSGASSLENIRDDFFKGMSQLQSLNLSGLRIKSSPSTISELTELRCLILRDCPELEDLPDLKSLTKLEVIDCRGARELKTCFDKEKGENKETDKKKNTGKNKSKNKNFYHLKNLQLLDLSESQIERLPIFQDSAAPEKLHSLTRLLLRDCSKLRRLPSLRPLSGLQVLDLSGTTSLVEMLEVCFEQKKELRILNLSNTNLSELPSTISELSNLTQFLLMDCPNLEALPNIEELTRLEEFDVSGCPKLEKIEGSFKRMSYLRKLNLRGTRIKTIPELPERSSLCCSKYIVLPDSTGEEGEDWRQIKEGLPSGTVESSSSSDVGTKTSEISKEESGLRGTHSNEPHSSVCPEKKGDLKKLVYHGDRYHALYKKTRQLVDPKSPLEIPEIRGSNDPRGLSSEFVSFVDISSTTVSDAFEAFKMISVKGYWVSRCKKMENLFSGEHEKHVGSLETLWVSNLPLLKGLCSESPEQSSFKHLKNLSIDCCPNITTFQLPSSVKVLHIKFCDKLEKVFDEDGEVPNLQTLHLVQLPVLSPVGAKLPKLETYREKNCPEFKDVTLQRLRQGITKETAEEDWIIVDRNEAAP